MIVIVIFFIVSVILNTIYMIGAIKISEAVKLIDELHDEVIKEMDDGK